MYKMSSDGRRSDHEGGAGAEFGGGGGAAAINDGNTTRKRGRNGKRVGMACRPCRLSKLKCDGNKPTCDRCAARRQSCDWAALDGRSIEAKKVRRSSSAAQNSIHSRGIEAEGASSSAAIDQLELLANAAVHSGGSSSTYPFIDPMSNAQLGNISAAALTSANNILPPATPVSATSSHAHLHSRAEPSALPSHPFVGGNAPSVTRTATPAAMEQQMWWEKGSPSVRRSGQTPTVGLGTDSAAALANVDWASLGLEPQQLTDDMMDMLTGRVVWVDPLFNASSNSNGAQVNENRSYSRNESDKSHSDTQSTPSGMMHDTSRYAHDQQQQDQFQPPSNRPTPMTDQAKSERVRIQYFRPMGPTGISPGIKKITMELKLTPSVRRALFETSAPMGRLQGAQRVDWERLIVGGSEFGASVTPSFDTSSGAMAGDGAVDQGSSSEEEEKASLAAAGLPSRPDLFDGDQPAPWVLQELLPIFFERLGDHYLCLNRAGLEARLGMKSAATAVATFTSDTQRSNSSRNVVPPMLINVICALAARFSTHPHIVAGRSAQRAHTFGKRFALKAKEFLVTCLAFPSRTTVLAFAMMAWHEFACNLDSAFWNYGGMALRMAIDLGLQRHSPSAKDSRDLSEADLIDDTLLFWAVYQMDRILVVGTGRPTSIKDREITCPLPSVYDARDNREILFAFYIRHVRIGGRIAETINAVLLPDESSRHVIQRELDELEAQLIESYESIPERFRLNTPNFKATDQKHLFLEFHLWFHNLLFILNRSPIVEMRASISPFDAARLVRKSVQRCADVVALDDTYDNKILESVPMANQTLFLAGCAELEETEQRTPPDALQSNNNPRQPSSSGHHLMREAEDGYRKFANALERISVFWDGVRWIHGVLTQRRLGHSHKDLVELAVGTDALVSKRELHLLKRLNAVSQGKGNESGTATPLSVDQGGGGGGVGRPLYAQNRASSYGQNSANNAPTTTTDIASDHPSTATHGLSISEIGSLDDLASLLPHVQSALAAHQEQDQHH